jgi:hypothetical protein
MDQTPKKINKHRKLPNAPTTMLRNIVAGKVAVGPLNTLDEEIINVLTP